jgi:hypothetical protein
MTSVIEPPGGIPVTGMNPRTTFAALGLTDIDTNARDAVATPTAGVLTKAAMESLVVEMLSPVLSVAATAAFAARVKPEQTTVTGPAGRVDPVLK